MSDKDESPEDTFRFGLEATRDIAMAMADHCQSVHELVAMVELALDPKHGGGQLSLLMKQVSLVGTEAKSTVSRRG